MVIFNSFSNIIHDHFQHPWPHIILLGQKCQVEMVQSSNPDWLLSEECPDFERKSPPSEPDLFHFDLTAIIC